MTQSEQILNMLRDAGGRGVPNYELAHVSLQYNARIFSLRRLGHNISKRRVYRADQPSNTYLYYLMDKSSNLGSGNIPGVVVEQEIPRKVRLLDVEPVHAAQRMDP